MSFCQSVHITLLSILTRHIVAIVSPCYTLSRQIHSNQPGRNGQNNSPPTPAKAQPATKNCFYDLHMTAAKLPRFACLLSIVLACLTRTPVVSYPPPAYLSPRLLFFFFFFCFAEHKRRTRKYKVAINYNDSTTILALGVASLTC